VPFTLPSYRRSKLKVNGSLGTLDHTGKTDVGPTPSILLRTGGLELGVDINILVFSSAVSKGML
jgi:hypothetical protein